MNLDSYIMVSMSAYLMLFIGTICCVRIAMLVNEYSSLFNEKPLSRFHLWDCANCWVYVIGVVSLVFIELQHINEETLILLTNIVLHSIVLITYVYLILITRYLNKHSTDTKLWYECQKQNKIDEFSGKMCNVSTVYYLTILIVYGSLYIMG